jgi:hypothetical protein
LFRGGVSFGNGGRDSGLKLMGARVVGGGGIVPGGSLAIVVGGCAGGRCGSTIGGTAGVRTADVLTVAGKTGRRSAVVVGAVVDIAGEVAVDTAVGSGLESLGVTICCAGRAG